MNVRELKKKYKIMDILNYFELSNEEDGKKIESDSLYSKSYY